MGTDIDGRVEFRPQGPGTPWQAADLDVGDLLRHYDAFGLLFGVRNFAGFEPVAPGRGLPEDRSDAVKAPDHTHDHTWVSWAELDAIDWNRPAPVTDDRIHHYEVTDDGPVLRGKGIMDNAKVWPAVAGDGTNPRGSSHPEGTEWRYGNTLYRVERMVPREVLNSDPGLRKLLDAMRDLAARYGDDNVRLVVWFDS